MGENVRSGGSLLTHFVQSFQRFIFSNEFVSFPIAILLLNSSCTNVASTTSSLLSNLNNLASPNVDTSAGSFELLTVLPSQATPGDYDLIGTNSQFDSYCQDTANPNTKCKCAFTYTQSGVGAQTVQANIVYQESNLVTCANPVPSGITTFTVDIVTISGSAYSNSQTVNLTGGAFANSTSYLDLSSGSSFSQVQRFQCRKLDFIANPLDPSVSDPFQSQNPEIIYPFNYYTTNVSASLLQLQQQTGVNWDCTLNSTQTGALQWWANPYVFSAASCSSAFCFGDGELMAPTNSLVSGAIATSTSTTNPNGKRRSSFALANQAYGVFQVPIQAAVAPLSYVAATYGVIGYGAQPISNSSGVSTCPNIQLPSNATWVKLWNFRATSITPPTAVTSSTSIAASGIACDPGSGAFAACAGATSTGGAAFDAQGSYTPSGLGHTIYSTSLNSSGTLAARVAILTSSGGTGSPADSCSIIDNTSWTAGEASEVWQPGFFGFDTTFPLASIESLPWNLYADLPSTTLQTAYTPAASTTNPSPTPSYYLSTNVAPYPVQVIPEATPADYSPNIVTATVAPSPSNYTDQLFVVSETTVNDSDMINSVASYYPYYLPVTYRSAADCSGTTQASCSSNSAKMINWNLSTQAVGSNTSGTIIYPVCVVQFYD